MFQSWDSFFRNSSAGAMPGQAYTAPPSLAEPARNTLPFSSVVPMFGGMAMPALGGQVNEKVIDDHLAVQAIIRSYQVFYNNLLMYVECTYNMTYIVALILFYLTGFH